jgi:hypothetical protein
LIRLSTVGPEAGKLAKGREIDVAEETRQSRHSLQKWPVSGAPESKLQYGQRQIPSSEALVDGDNASPKLTTEYQHR